MQPRWTTGILFGVLVFCCFHASLRGITFDDALVRLMWQTPIEQISLVGRGGISPHDLHRLRQEIMLYYRSFVEARRGKNKKQNKKKKDKKIEEEWPGDGYDEDDNEDASMSISDSFYAHQQRIDLQFKRCLLEAAATNASSSSSFSSSSTMMKTKVKTKVASPSPTWLRARCPPPRPPLFDDLTRIFHAALQHYLDHVLPSHHRLPTLDVPHIPSHAAHADDHDDHDHDEDDEDEEDRARSSSRALSSSDEYFQLFAWASVHPPGSHHPAHHHVNSAISGVLYIDVPAGSGDIVFEDPRGALPPFGKSLHLTPTAGDLILFPGYVMHRVEPSRVVRPTTRSQSAKAPIDIDGDTDTDTASDWFRISVSFNYEGPWEMLSDVNAGYRV